MSKIYIPKAQNINVKYLFWAFWMPVICFIIAVTYGYINESHERENSPNICWEAMLASRQNLIWEPVEYERDSVYEEAKIADISDFFPENFFPNISLIKWKTDVDVVIWNNELTYFGKLRNNDGFFSVILNDNEKNSIPIGRIDDSVFRIGYPDNNSLILVSVITFLFCLASYCLAWLNNNGNPNIGYLRALTGWLVLISLGFVCYLGSQLFDIKLPPKFIINYSNIFIVCLWVISEISLLSGLYYYLIRNNENLENNNIPKK